METSPGFYMISASVMKELKKTEMQKELQLQKKEIIHFFPFVNEEESVTIYELKLIHFFIRLYFL